MKLSEILFAKTKELWDEASSKPFVIDMAKGTLDKALFRRYMLQDYLYLQDYIAMLNEIKGICGDEKTAGFLDEIIAGTTREAETVHRSNMEELGITDEELAKSVSFPVITEYVSYMRGCVETYGLLGGLTALLQCSWVYAYIAEKTVSSYADEITKSEYGSWFEAYSCQSYLNTNQMWIDLLDKECEGSDEALASEMCVIFERCARFENEFWDELYT